MPFQFCSQEDDLVSSSGGSVFEIRTDGLEEINNEVNLCPGQTDICCKPISITQGPDPEPFVHKCGRHIPNAFGLKASRPVEGKLGTSFGEWPHACVLINKNTKNVIGGATLIAPGVVVTTAHKVRNLSPGLYLV